MFLRLLGIEARKLLKHPILWLEFGGLTLIFAVYFIIRSVSVAASTANTHGLETDLQMGLAFFGMFNVLFYAATAAFISAYDYPDYSIQMWLVRGVPRSLFMLARLTIILLLGFVQVLFTVFLILGSAALARTVFLGSFTVENLDWMQLFPVILCFFAASIPYLILTVLFAIISRSPLFAAGGTLIFATVVENLLSGLSDRYPGMIQFIPSHLARLLQFHTGALDRSAPLKVLTGAYTTEPLAILSIAVLLVALSGLSLLFFARQDLGGSL
jgi:hypothetical protein